jgi:hypothetical protein
MASFHSFLTPARRSLANHLARLCDTLDGLGKQVREAITRAIGRAVAEAVTEAVESMLAVTVIRSRPTRYPSQYDRQSEFWERSANTSWRDEPDEWDDREGIPSRYVSEEDDPFPFASNQRLTIPYQTRLRLAILIGCQATGWWLQRRPRRFAVPGALCIGLFSGLVTFASGSTILAGAGGVLSALSLFALGDAVRAGAIGMVNTDDR